MISLKHNIHDHVINEVNLKLFSSYTSKIFGKRSINIIAWPVYHSLKQHHDKS